MKTKHLIPTLFLTGFCTVSAQTNTSPANPPAPALLTTNQVATPPTGGPRDVRPHGATSADVMLNSLRLDDATRAKAKPILDDELKKMLDLQADKTLSSDERAVRNKSIKADTDAQLKLVLTDDQYAQWQQLLQPKVSNHPVPVNFNSMRDGKTSQPSQSQQNAPSATPPAAPPQN